MTRSRIEADREDLLAEAANLPERVELQIARIDNPVTIGRNRQGHWSFYFGAEPVSRFDQTGGLRRLVRGGKLYRTQGTTLAELTRVRLEHETQLQRRDLSIDETESILHRVRSELAELHEALATKQASVLREVGTSPEFFEVLETFLARIVASPISLAAAIPTKRS